MEGNLPALPGQHLEPALIMCCCNVLLLRGRRLVARCLERKLWASLACARRLVQAANVMQRGIWEQLAYLASK